MSPPPTNVLHNVGTPRRTEPGSLATLVDEALRINTAALSRHQVKEVRQLAYLPPVMTDKHKVLIFGLHSCAVAAQELGGTLKAHSEGPGRGATFTLELLSAHRGDTPLLMDTRHASGSSTTHRP